MHEWLKELKAGDEVVIDTRYGGRLVKVTKVTKTQIVIDTWRFNRDNGRLRGQHGGFDFWSLRKATPVLRELIERRQLVSGIVAASGQELMRIDLTLLREFREAILFEKTRHEESNDKTQKS